MPNHTPITTSSFLCRLLEKFLASSERRGNEWRENTIHSPVNQSVESVFSARPPLQRNLQQHVRLLVILLIFLLLLVGGASCTDREKSATSYLARGEALFAQGDYVKARLEFRNVLQIEPKSVAAYYYLGQIAEKEQDWKQSFALYSKVVELDPGHVEARLKTAQFYLLGGELEEAARIVDSVLASRPGDQEARILKAMILVRQGSEDQAFELARDVWAKDRQQVQAAIVLSSLYLKRGEHDSGEAVLREGIESNPDAGVLYLTYAQFAISRNELDKAASLLRRLIELEPDQLEHRKRLARFLAETGELDAAEAVLREAVDLAPDDTRRVLLLTDFLAKKRGIPEAEAELRRRIDADPGSLEYQFALAVLYRAMGRTEDAVAMYRDIIGREGLRPDGLKARSHLAEMLFQQGDLEGSKKLVDEVLKESPTNSDALLIRGRMALAFRDIKGAIADFRAVLRGQPDALSVRSLLASAQILNNEPELARENLRRVLEGQPDNLDARLALARVSLMLRDEEEARALVGEVLAQQPDNLKALLALLDTHIARKAWTDARATADRIIAAHPGNPIGYYRQGRLSLARGDAAGAASAFRKGLDIAPDNVQLALALAGVFERQGEADKAMALYEQILERHPGAIVAANNLAANLVEHRGDRESLRRALELALPFENSDNPFFLDTLGWAYFKSGRLDEALRVLNRAVESEAGRVPIIQYHLGMVYYSKGDLASAKTWLQASVAHELEFAGMEEARRILKELGV